MNLVGKKMFSDSDIKSKLKIIPKNVYGNTLESLIGAIYIDKGIKQAQKFIIKYIYGSEFIEGLSDLGAGKVRVLGTPLKTHALSGFDLEVLEYLSGPED